MADGVEFNWERDYGLNWKRLKEEDFVTDPRDNEHRLKHSKKEYLDQLNTSIERRSMIR